ncbi:YkvA family protein [Luteolibacter marinus]|uniref:YkvA family protein n=1 Tax=Luteolibacter marinus TaxID=2776705 RepID=UPI001866E61E|nr:YkvA family protein [Luteolibacter marinus]
MDPELPSRYHAPGSYSAHNLWRKLSRYALVAGRKTVLTALTLYHCLRDADTPTWAKGVIVGALGYLILPADLVPDIIPGAGYGDDWAALVAALGTVAAYVKDVHKLKASVQTEKIFGLKGH